MKNVKIRNQTSQPSEQDAGSYPDYLITRLLQKGIGRVEANYDFKHDGIVDFVFTSPGSLESELFGTISQHFFRSVLAKFGFLCSVEDTIYAGYSAFVCEQEGSGNSSNFSLFICNDLRMGFWMKLYLHKVDGPKQANEETKS